MKIFSRRSGSKKGNDVDKLEDKLYIGMPIQEIISLLGKPSGVNLGTEMIEEGSHHKVVVSDEMRSELSKTMYYLWKRPEGIYALIIVNNKLARIYMKP